VATESIKYIKPSGQGGDYTSLSAWEAGEQADLVSLDRIAVAECSGDWSATVDDDFFQIGGWTTDSTRYIKIRTDSANLHAGTWDPDKYVFGGYRTASGSLIDISQSNVTIEGLQLTYTPYSTTTKYLIYIGNAATNVLLDRCILRGDTGAGSASCGVYVSTNSDGCHLKLRNCVIYDHNAYGVYEYYSSGSTVDIAACTVCYCGTGIRRIQAAVRVPAVVSSAGVLRAVLGLRVGRPTAIRIALDALSASGQAARADGERPDEQRPTHPHREQAFRRFWPSARPASIAAGPGRCLRKQSRRRRAWPPRPGA
jgi:hypothetical protein